MQLSAPAGRSRRHAALALLYHFDATRVTRYASACLRARAEAPTVSPRGRLYRSPAGHYTRAADALTMSLDAPRLSLAPNDSKMRRAAVCCRRVVSAFWRTALISAEREHYRWQGFSAVPANAAGRKVSSSHLRQLPYFIYFDAPMTSPTHLMPILVAAFSLIFVAWLIS